MTRKKLAISKALFSLVAFLGFFLLCAFFFTYGKEAAKELIEKLQSEPVESGQINLSGLGPAVLLVLCIVALICFALPELLFLISFSGNFGKQGSTIGFTVVSLVAEVFAGVILTFFTAIPKSKLHFNIPKLITKLFMLSQIISILKKVELT